MTYLLECTEFSIYIYQISFPIFSLQLPEQNSDVAWSIIQAFTFYDTRLFFSKQFNYTSGCIVRIQKSFPTIYTLHSPWAVIRNHPITVFISVDVDLKMKDTFMNNDFLIMKMSFSTGDPKIIFANVDWSLYRHEKQDISCWLTFQIRNIIHHLS